MTSLFQYLEFAYPNGLLFYDRSGALSRRIQEKIPGLQFKSSALDQLNFTAPALDLELLFGIGYASIQSTWPDHEDFPAVAATFLKTVAETLEVSQLNRFRFRHVSGRLCASPADARRSLDAFLTPEARWTPFGPITPDVPLSWTGMQTEFSIGDFNFELRAALIDLVPHPSMRPASTPPGIAVTHFTSVWDVQGTAPIDVAGFDAKSFMENARQTHKEGTASKFASSTSL